MCCVSVLGACCVNVLMPELTIASERIISESAATRRRLGGGGETKRHSTCLEMSYTFLAYL